MPDAKEPVKPRMPSEILRDYAATLGEHFKECMIIVQDGHDFMWYASNDTWCIGAARRFLTSKEAEDHYSAIREAQARGQKEETQDDE